MTVSVSRTNWGMAQQINITGTVTVPSGSQEVVTVISGGPASTTKVTAVTGPATPSLDVEHFAIKQASAIDANVAVMVRDATTKVPSSVFTDAATVVARPAIGTAPVGLNIRPDLYTSSTILNLLPAAQCVRIGIAWSTAQPSSSTWDATQLALYDAVFADLATRGIKAQVTCGTTPAWARTGGTTLSPATNPVDHANFVQSIVSRWGSQILCVDPWNEPDLSFSGTAAQYVALLSAVRTAVSVGTPVCLGPFSLANVTYLQSLFTAGLTGAMFNWLDLHPYPFSHGSGTDSWIEPTAMPPAAQADGGVIPGIHKLEATLAAHGITNVPLIISEIGVATDPVDQTAPQMRMGQDDAASWLSRCLDLVRRLPTLQAVNVHQGRDVTTATGWTESFGLLDQNNNRRAVWSTVSNIVGATWPFNPLTQVAPLHAVWAGDPMWSHPADGGAVSTWRNQSGGGDPAQATGVNQPLYRASVAGLGSKPTVEFDGVNDLLSFDIVDFAQTFKIVCVFKQLSLINGSRIFGTGGSNARGLGLNGTHTLYQTNFGTNLGFGTPDTNGHVLRMNVAGASSSIWLDGVSVSTGNPGSNGVTNWVLGSGEGGNPANVQISFFAFYSGATLDTDLAQLETALKSNYGL